MYDNKRRYCYYGIQYLTITLLAMVLITTIDGRTIKQYKLWYLYIQYIMYTYIPTTITL